MRIAVFLAALLSVFLQEAPAADGKSKLPPFNKADVPPAPDYAQAASWLDKPDDPDRFGVDIFWVYPTVLYDTSAWLMNIERKDLIEGAAMSVASEAHAFSGQANLYAPLYRQMNLAGFNLPEAERDAIVAYGEEDVRRAFAYYLENHNNGRPVILAAHSQGSYVLTQLLVHHWGKIGVEDRVIAGYVVGWSLTEQDLKDNPAIEICDLPHQTGCFVSYNSVAPGKQSLSPLIQPGAIVVNPLTWTRDTALAPASLNLGSTFFNEDGSSETLPGFASAQIADGGLAVVAKDPKRLESRFFAKGVYHSFDYPLFFENISANVAQRTQAFLTGGK
ncbi:DUF3089 domain-containing protein [Roseibium aggregatum]|uniref:DUF3089 domain-containing protein n=1 Tax=Roseibium aggregatum TaxID=187304 RepID=A0A939EA24_9HYPH|nr:DUF3089 domain-containing protein [Roseibium aggregatum]MBN9669616.1 DUF3089 domain-containing protein [Roseibium aggregatum]